MGGCFTKSKLNPLHIPDKVTRKDLPKFVPRIRNGKVIEVYDGDTITIAAYESGELFQFQVRLIGIDTPEKRTKDENEKLVALIAKMFLEELLLYKTVQLKNIGMDKYGRILANVYFEDNDVSSLLISNRLGVPYFGKTKSVPTNWLKYYEGN